jgi:hypothetical protein
MRLKIGKSFTFKLLQVHVVKSIQSNSSKHSKLKMDEEEDKQSPNFFSLAVGILIIAVAFYIWDSSIPSSVGTSLSENFDDSSYDPQGDYI